MGTAGVVQFAHEGVLDSSAETKALSVIARYQQGRPGVTAASR